MSSKLSFKTKITLNDGVKIPVIGLGTWETQRGLRTIQVLRDEKELDAKQSAEHDAQEKELLEAVKYAIVESGYRHLDSAHVYGSEELIGKALKDIFANTAIKREDIFVTTKFPTRHTWFGDCEEVIERSFRDLDLKVIDLYLLHSPHSIYPNGHRLAGLDNLMCYKYLLKLKSQGRIRSIGVSNYSIAHLEMMKSLGLAKPSVNQIEVSCFLYEKELIDYCKKEGIAIEAYSSLARARPIAFSNPLLAALGKKHGKSWSQVMLRYCLQKGMIILPKSSKFSRIDANSHVFDFQLDEDDMNSLDSLNVFKFRTCWNPMKNVLWGDRQAIAKAMWDGQRSLCLPRKKSKL